MTIQESKNHIHFFKILLKKEKIFWMDMNQRSI